MKFGILGEFSLLGWFLGFDGFSALILVSAFSGLGFVCFECFGFCVLGFGLILWFWVGVAILVLMRWFSWDLLVL